MVVKVLNSVRDLHKILGLFLVDALLREAFASAVLNGSLSFCPQRHSAAKKKHWEQKKRR